MIRRPPAVRRSRRGAAAVEFAIVAIPLLLVLFGIYEFARYVMTLQTLENAAREGARFAVVNTYSPTVEADAIAEVRRRLAGVDVTAFGAPASVSVYAADAAGNPVGPPQNAPFGTPIGVRIRGTYHTVLPSLLGLPDTIGMDVKAMMNSEAN